MSDQPVIGRVVPLGEARNVGPGSVADKVPPGAIEVALIYLAPDTHDLQLVTRLSDDPAVNAEIARLLDRAARQFRSMTS